MAKLNALSIFTDGASRGNPGNAAAAFVIEDGKGNILGRHSKAIGVTTNNVAEYTAVINALKAASHYGHREIFCFSDSKLAVNQLNSVYKIRKKHLQKLFRQVKNLEKKFKRVTFSYLPRTNPKIARVDKLVNRELDKLG